jgi:LacI family transcriptional regulator
METIARKLGVSKTTVHYALRDTGRVSKQMREKVRALARDLGYRPNRLARSLRTKRTDTLGVVLVSLRSTFHARLLGGIESAAQEREFGALLAISNHDFSVEKQRVELLLEKGIDGLIVAPAPSQESTAYYERLIEDGVKIVFIDRDVPGLNVDAVSTDNELGGYLAAKHLIGRGRKSIAFLLPSSTESTSARGRLDGWTRALQEVGMKPSIVLGSDVPDQETDEEYASLAVKSYLSSKRHRFDALFAAHDGLAFGAVNALAQEGLSVPDDVAVVGFDDQDSSGFFQPPLTTIRQPAELIGREAVRVLFREFSEPSGNEPRQRILLDPTLVVRASCGDVAS